MIIELCVSVPKSTCKIQCKIAVEHDFCNFEPFFLVNSQNPPIKIVRKFLHLLDQSNVDFEEELGKQAFIAVMISIASKLPSFGIGLGDIISKINLS